MRRSFIMLIALAGCGGAEFTFTGGDPSMDAAAEQDQDATRETTPARDQDAKAPQIELSDAGDGGMQTCEHGCDANTPPIDAGVDASPPPPPPPPPVCSAIWNCNSCTDYDAGVCVHTTCNDCACIERTCWCTGGVAPTQCTQDGAGWKPCCG